MNRVLNAAVEITVEDVLALEPKERNRAVVALMNLYAKMFGGANRVDAFTRRECMDIGFDPKGLNKNEVESIIEEVQNA